MSNGRHEGRGPAAWTVRTRHRKKPCVRQREEAGSHGAHARRRARIPAQAPAASACHLQPSSLENAERLTGYGKPGGICPFGLRSAASGIRADILSIRDVVHQCGRGVIAVIRPEALRLSGAVAGDILSGGPGDGPWTTCMGRGNGLVSDMIRRSQSTPPTNYGERCNSRQ